MPDEPAHRRPPLRPRPLLRAQQQRITALEADNAALLRRLAEQEQRLALYRHIDEDDDRLRALTPSPEDAS